MGWLWLLPALLILLLAWLLFWPLRPLGSVPAAQPVGSYAEAVERIAALQLADRQDASLQAVCQIKLWTHGQATRHVFVIFHGFSNCPEQFNQFAGRLYGLGHNVLIPRQPHHGLADRLTHSMQRLSAEDLLAFGSQAVDLACGLGQEVAVLGISGGANLAGWLAHNRPGVGMAILIAPMMGVSFVPAPLSSLFARLLFLLPDRYLWWDPRTRENNPYSAAYAYPGYSLHAMAEVLRLGLALHQQAGQTAPLARRLLIVINDAEPGVNNRQVQGLLASWQRHPQVSVSKLVLEAALKLPHDIITPGTPGLPFETVYERLITAIQAALN